MANKLKEVKIDRIQKEGKRMVSSVIIDNQLSIEMAKEIGMIKRNEKVMAVLQSSSALREWHRPEKIMVRGYRIAQESIEGMIIGMKITTKG